MGQKNKYKYATGVLKNGAKNSCVALQHAYKFILVVFIVQILGV
jgi:hypothetical protein